MPSPPQDDTSDRRPDAMVQRLPRRVRPVVRRLSDRNLLTSASSLAFYGLISALPTLMVAFAAVGAVAGEQTLSSFVDQAAASGPQGTEDILERLVAHSDGINLVTLLLIVWPATAYGAGLRRVLVTSSRRDDPVGLTGLLGRLRALSFVVALPLLLLAGMPLVFVLTTLSGDGAFATILGWVLALAAAVVLAAAMITLLYQTFAPDDLGLRESVKAALLSSTAMALFSVAFVAYLNLGNVEDRFGGGTTAIVILLGLWLFVANIVLLAGYHAVSALENDGTEG